MTFHPGKPIVALSQKVANSWAADIFLSIAAVLFIAAQFAINDVNGWWNDELSALWASDTSVPFTSAYVNRISPDTNPPLYFSALYWTRLFISNDRAAILVLNAGCIVAAGLTVLAVSVRPRLTALAAIAFAAFVLSGPVLLFAAEGRAYLSALAVSFVASWCVALAIEAPDSRPSLVVFCALGALAALIHVYAALFCGALAGGLFVLSVLDKRWRSLVTSSLALGLSASLTLGIWLLTVTGSIGRVGWIKFTPEAVSGAIWYVKEITVGNRMSALLLVVLLLFGIARKATRPIVFVFSLAFVLFIALPLLASLKQPMIMGRYWIIGAPSLIVLMAFLARSWWRELRDGTLMSPTSLAVLGAGVLALVSSYSGFLAAKSFTASKPIWRGAEVTAPLLKECPEGSVHVASGTISATRTSLHYFARMAGTSSALFLDAGADATPSLSVAAARCPVMGWAEHVLLGDDFLIRATDAELLRLLKIDATPAEVDVRRHKSGFVVLSRGPQR